MEEFFRDRLRYFRNERRISAREMSLALGQNESFINKIETGKCTTTMTSFFNICEYLTISPAEFFDGSVLCTEGQKDVAQYFKMLTPRQSEYMIEFLKDLSKSNAGNGEKISSESRLCAL